MCVVCCVRVLLVVASVFVCWMFVDVLLWCVLVVLVVVCCVGWGLCLCGLFRVCDVLCVIVC